MRGLLREFGLTTPAGAKTFLDRLPQLVEHHRERLPEAVRRVVLAFWDEAYDLDQKMREIEKELEALTREHPVLQSLLEIPGIGVITATALYASVGNVHLFKSGRHLANWLGMTPRSTPVEASVAWAESASRAIPTCAPFSSTAPTPH